MSDKSSENLRGMLLLTLGMGVIAGVDAVTKALGPYVEATWIMVGIGFGAVLGFSILSWGRYPILSRVALQPLVMVRTLSEAIASALITIAVILVPLTTVTVLMQSVPLIITLGAVLFLGERVGWKDWAALFAGFVGMLIIVRPGGDALDATALLAVGAAISFALRDLASRAVSKDISTFQLGIWGGLALFLAALAAALALGHPPPAFTLEIAAGFFAIFVLVTIGLYCITGAMRIGDVAVIAPFRYTRLIFGIALGIAFFGEQLDGATILGGAIIVASGLYVWRRELRRRQAARS